jgi:hypothetical protein
MGNDMTLERPFNFTQTSSDMTLMKPSTLSKLPKKRTQVNVYRSKNPLTLSKLLLGRNNNTHSGVEKVKALLKS